MKDDLLHGLRNADIANIKYHVNTCYPNYRKNKKRLQYKRTNDTSNSTTFFANIGTSNPIYSRAKRVKTVQIKAIKSHIWNIALFIIKTNFEEIVENWASVKQGEQSSSFLQSSLIKMRFLQDGFIVKPLVTYLLLTWCTIETVWQVISWNLKEMLVTV